MTRVYPVRVTEYYKGLIREKGDPIWKQCIPDPEELNDNENDEDPLLEEQYTPVPFLVHRYPDRVLMLVSNRCAVYCRFCTRKRKVGREVEITPAHIQDAIDYVAAHPEVRDVILSGGDPLMLSDSEIESILKRLRAIPHLQIIRIGTRVPCTFPMRVTEKLASMLARYRPLYVNVHFEHPRELTPESQGALELLADAGLPLGNQSVLLKGVNDDAEVLKELFHRLLMNRVRPYYLYQADQVKGTEHFRTSVQDGLKIMEDLYGFTSGLAIPQYVIDAPGGGKIPILPEFVTAKDERKFVLRNFEGRRVEYANPRKRSPSGLKVAIIYNEKRAAPAGMPKDAYAEFDDISVPLAIKQALDRNGHSATLVEADERIYDRLRKSAFDIAFNLAEGLHGEARESHVPAILEMLRIPYTGSGVMALALTLDKALTSSVLSQAGIPTPKHQTFVSAGDKLDAELRFPLIVKPNSEGSSKGIRNDSLVFSPRELKRKVAGVIRDYRQPALVEEFLEGREFTVPMLGNPPKVLPIVEVTFDHLPKGMHRFDSYEAKWEYDVPGVDPLVCPARLDRKLEQRIRDTAMRAFHTLGMRDLCRIDMRLDSRGVPNVIEVNALPGLMPDPLENSRFPRSCFSAGMSYEDIILAVLNAAAQRSGISLEQPAAVARRRPASMKE